MECTGKKKRSKTIVFTYRGAKFVLKGSILAAKGHKITYSLRIKGSGKILCLFRMSSADEGW